MTGRNPKGSIWVLPVPLCDWEVTEQFVNNLLPNTP